MCSIMVFRFHSFVRVLPSSHFLSGVNSSFSSVSTTNTASSLAGSVLLAFSSRVCRSPGISGKFCPARYVTAGPSLDLFIILRVVVLVLIGGYQHRGAFVLHEEHDEFRRFGLASVSPDDVNILRAFIEGLTRGQSHFFPALDLHYDRAFQHINKSMCVVAMYWVRAARRILNQEHQTFLSRKVRQVFRHELLQLRFLGFRRGSHR